MSVSDQDLPATRQPGPSTAEHAMPVGDPLQVHLRCCIRTRSYRAPAVTIVVLEVSGELDLDTTPALHGALVEALAPRPDHLLVDLAAVNFCDVGGLTHLVNAARTANRQQTGYALGALPAHLVRVCALLWTADELPQRYPTVSAGIVAAMRRHTPPREPTRSSP